MGNSNSSSDHVFHSENCTNLDDRTAFLLLKNYVQLARLRTVFLKISSDNEEYNKMIVDINPFLIDASSMLELLKEIPEEIRDQFSKIEQKIIGANQIREISIYDKYNDFFIDELVRFGENKQKVLERIKQFIDTFDTKLSIILNIMNNMCI